MFNSGGEFPVIVPQGPGTAKLEYRQFGTRIEATPLLVGDGKVRVQVSAKVSDVEASDEAATSASPAPRMRETMVDTAVELRFGESLVLSGPAQRRLEQKKDEAGQVIRETVSDVETVVVITPTLAEGQPPKVFPQPFPASYSPSLPTAIKAIEGRLRQ
jgi:pilus assembly protein CpaC